MLTARSPIRFTLSQIRAMWRPCDYCNEPFLPTHNHHDTQLYCSSRCCNAASRDRQILREIREAA